MKQTRWRWRNGASVAVAGVVLAVAAGCGGAARTPYSAAPYVYTPAPTEPPFSLQVVDTLTKPSLEPGKTVVAVLLKGDRVPYLQHFDDSAIKRVDFTAQVRSCMPTRDFAKTLDPLHPDAVQPALSRDPGGPFYPIYEKPPVSNAPEYAGWVSWQVDPTKVGCDNPLLPFKVEVDANVVPQFSGYTRVQSLATFSVSLPAPAAPATYQIGDTVTVEENGRDWAKITITNIGQDNYLIGSDGYKRQPQVTDWVVIHALVTYEALTNSVMYNDRDWLVSCGEILGGRETILPVGNPLPQLLSGSLSSAGSKASGYVVWDVPPNGEVRMSYIGTGTQFEVIIRPS